MKRLFAGVLALAMLCSCAPYLPASDSARAPGEPDSLPFKLSFAVDISTGDIVYSAAEKFCRRAAILSRGQLDISPARSVDVFAALDSGEASIVLAGNAAASERHRLFAMASESFRYGSYEEFTMTLNAKKTLRALSSASGLHVFGAYYTGSNVFAGEKTPDGTLFVSREESTEASETQLGIYTVEGSGSDAALALPGFEVAEVLSPQERLAALFVPGKLSELTFSEIAPTSLRAARLLHETSSAEGEDEATPSEEASGATRIVITRGFHSATPAWLAFKGSLYESLPENEKAALAEAAAYLAGEIDSACLDLENARFAELAELELADLEPLSGMRSTRRRVSQARNSAAARLPDDERAFANLLNSVY
jgi:hypothetical protein